MKPLIFLSAAALLVAGAAHAQTAPGQTAPAAKPCQEPERRQFDFWVGDWDVYPTGKTVLVAHSKIENLYGGCAVRENWMPLKGTGGGSLNAYVPHEKTWKQTWVGSGGERVDFTGGLRDGAMVLTGDWMGIVTPGQAKLTRMTYTPAADGSVRQFGETSDDGGKTWAANFDFTYRPRKPG
jgi:hypothetical protein